MRNTRIRLIYNYLKKYSSNKRKVPITDLINHLNNEGIEVSRNTVKSDVKALKEFGIPINESVIRAGAMGYYLESAFNSSQYRIIIDSIGANKFIKENERKEILEKILMTVSLEERKKLKSITKTRLIDTGEVNVSENISLLHNAISEKRYISFYTMKRNMDRRLVRKDYKKNIIPKEIYYENDRYYLIALYDNNEKRHFRIDRISSIIIGDYHNNDIHIDLTDYHIKNFDMFSDNKVERVELRVKKFLLDSIIEKFGDAASIYECYDDESCFRLCIYVGINRGLVRWILKQGSDVVVTYPDSLIVKIKDEIEKMSGNYK